MEKTTQPVIQTKITTTKQKQKLKNPVKLSKLKTLCIHKNPNSRCLYVKDESFFFNGILENHGQKDKN